MPEPTAALQALRASTADLMKGLDEEHWSDADVTAESLCQGWTRGNVLTHLARNADGITTTLSGALRGEVVERYPDGWAARDEAIEAGARRPVAELIADVTETAERLDRVCGAVTDAGAWDAETAQDKLAHEWIPRRLCEVEVHRVDLAGAYTPDRWPPLLVTDLLSHLGTSLSDRAPEGGLVVTVLAEGSVAPELAGELYSNDGGAAVSGPDWAVLAWLTGRGSLVADVLTATPPLGPWR